MCSLQSRERHAYKKIREGKIDQAFIKGYICEQLKLDCDNTIAKRCLNQKVISKVKLMRSFIADLSSIKADSCCDITATLVCSMFFARYTTLATLALLPK